MAFVPFLQRSFSSSETPKAGATLFQRISSFVLGAGLTAVVTQYYIFEEVRQGNRTMVQKQQELEQRVLALEKKH